MSGALLVGGSLDHAPPVHAATLALQQVSPGPFNPGSPVQVRLHMSDVPVLNPAAGFQAFLQFDTTRLSFVSGTYTAVPFGLPVITPVQADGSNIDLAAGINFFAGQLPSSADATLVTLNFQVLTDCDLGSVVFRAHEPPTALSNAVGLPIEPLVLVNLARSLTCPSDVEVNGRVDVDDLLKVIQSWGPCPQPSPACCPGNTNGDAAVNVNDLLDVIVDWGLCP
jgi:hypothetical protein